MRIMTLNALDVVVQQRIGLKFEQKGQYLIIKRICES